jgi:hypothetical protein
MIFGAMHAYDIFVWNDLRPMAKYSWKKMSIIWYIIVCQASKRNFAPRWNDPRELSASLILISKDCLLTGKKIRNDMDLVPVTSCVVI